MTCWPRASWKEPMYQYKLKGRTFDFKTKDGVFYPTDTSELLISGSVKAIKKPGSFLDLGCGSGVIGIVLAKLGLIDPPIHASDLSDDAVALAEENSKSHGYKMVAKIGPLFEPWKGRKFDIIVDDVPGITEEVAAFSQWFSKGVPCMSGDDGTSLVNRVIEEAPDHLNAGGIFIFPILSLSDTDKLIQTAQKNFKCVERVLRRMWSLPDEMKPHTDFLKKLHQEKKIRLEEKFGMVLWYTEVYCASNPRKGE